MPGVPVTVVERNSAGAAADADGCAMDGTDAPADADGADAPDAGGGVIAANAGLVALAAGDAPAGMRWPEPYAFPGDVVEAGVPDAGGGVTAPDAGRTASLAGDAAGAADVADALAGAGDVARCTSAGTGAVSPACVTAALGTVPGRVPAGAGFDAASAAVGTAATGVASATVRAGVAVVDEAGRGAVGAACSTGFAPPGISSVLPDVLADAKASAD